jgi:CheY-like chemotaxis protein
MPSILIFESDPTFAHEIQGALLARQCTVSIVDDAALGLEKATSAPPDLILLCAELPRMNGFSVCNRLRGNPALQRVPVIIMSANSSEDTFQQHRNLAKKRADDYVHKPLSVAALLEHVERLLPLSNGSSQPPAALADGVLDEMEELEADDLLTEDAVGAPESSQPQVWSKDEALNGAIGVSTDDLDAFAENAFGSLLADNHERRANESTAADSFPPAPASLPPPSAPPPSFTHGTQSSPPDAVAGAVSVPPPARLPSEIPGMALVGTNRSSVPPASRNEDSQTLIALQLELANAKESISDLEEALSASKERDQKLEALYAELDDARARLASGGGGRAKDVLDLREQLNAKEKSLLDLRDQLTRKEKELLATKDNALELERRTADAQDRAVDLEKRLHASERSEHAAIQDRDQAAKRAETHRRKAEKLAEEQVALRGEFEALREVHGQTALDRDALQGELTQLQTTLATTQATLEARQSQLQSTESNLATVTLERDQSVAALGETRAQLSDATQQIEALEQRQRQAEAQLNDTSAVLEQTRVTVNDLSRDLSAKSQEVDSLSESLNESQRALTDMTAQCDRALGRGRDLDAALLARTTEFSELSERHQTVSQRLAKAEEQLDQSQLQAAELAEHVDRHRVAAGEIGGLLGDALNKLREIQPA